LNAARHLSRRHLPPGNYRVDIYRVGRGGVWV
jgi:hypothetical protein